MIGRRAGPRWRHDREAEQPTCVQVAALRQPAAVHRPVGCPAARHVTRADDDVGSGADPADHVGAWRGGERSRRPSARRCRRRRPARPGSRAGRRCPDPACSAGGAPRRCPARARPGRRSHPCRRGCRRRTRSPARGQRGAGRRRNGSMLSASWYVGTTSVTRASRSRRSRRRARDRLCPPSHSPAHPVPSGASGPTVAGPTSSPPRLA